MKRIKAEEFDRLFDEGEDIDEYVDWDQGRWPGIEELAKAARQATGLTQKAFCERYAIPLASFREWEQGRRRADKATQSYLRVIAQIPDQVAAALAGREEAA